MVNRKYIDQLMLEQGITSYPQLAKVCNLHYTTLLYIFKGHNPGVATLKSIADYFDVSIDSLLISTPPNYVYIITEVRKRKIKLKSKENIKYLMFYLLLQEE